MRRLELLPPTSGTAAIGACVCTSRLRAWRARPANVCATMTIVFLDNGRPRGKFSVIQRWTNQPED